LGTGIEALAGVAFVKPAEASTPDAHNDLETVLHLSPNSYAAESGFSLVDKVVVYL
jgi:hypothetical protein